MPSSAPIRSMGMSVPPGWYAGPSWPPHLRWWDGGRWTGHVTGMPGRQPRSSWWIAVLTLIVCMPIPLLIAGLFVVQVYLLATCPAGATCSIDPTESGMAVSIRNDAQQQVEVVEIDCPPGSCRSHTLNPGESTEAYTSDGAAENLYLVRDRRQTVLGCFPLLYWRRPATEPDLAVSQAGECLTVHNDLNAPIDVEVRCPVKDCDWTSESDVIDPGQSTLTGVDGVHTFRLKEAPRLSWPPVPDRVVGCLPDPMGQHTATLLASAVSASAGC